MWAVHQGETTWAIVLGLAAYGPVARGIDNFLLNQATVMTFVARGQSTGALIMHTPASAIRLDGHRDALRVIQMGEFSV